MSLPFHRKLVLPHWLVRQFGLDPFGDRSQLDHNALGPMASIVRDVPEGITENNVHGFFEALRTEYQSSATIKSDEYDRYERNIVQHTRHLSELRQQSVVWKYFQWLALLFVEVYLDKYFANPSDLRRSLNAFTREFSSHWRSMGIDYKIAPYAEHELNKVCIQCATGSGKTLIMHANMLQYEHFAALWAPQSNNARRILITPNEEMSAYHVSALRQSGFSLSRLALEEEGLLSQSTSDRGRIDFTEVTKLGETDQQNIVAVRNFGNNNVLFVDEAHRGMGSREEKGWLSMRERLSSEGFAFEYSATIKEAVTAAGDASLEQVYTKSILFDYSYRDFHNDGYGKDYRIFNLPESIELMQYTYLVACLLTFYQQLKVYESSIKSFGDYNIEKPLWVFVGSSVSRTGTGRAEKETLSDVGRIIEFLAQFVNDSHFATACIRRIVLESAKDTGLVDSNGKDIFEGQFLYIQELIDSHEWSFEDVFNDICRLVFRNKGGGRLSLCRIKGSDGEVSLRIGRAAEPFGLIFVGDAIQLMKHICGRKLTNVVMGDTEFSGGMFRGVTSSRSPINVLIGSKKFIEGWDCWRVSTLGLMRVGRSEGTQIVQLFGRGVRLKGHNWSLKRSGYATPTVRPKNLHFLEVLNVFGIEADFMQRFRSYLRSEGLPDGNDQQVFATPLLVTYDFGRELMILRPRKKDGGDEEWNFDRDGPAVILGSVPEGLLQQPIEVNWYSRIQFTESGTKVEARMNIETQSLSADHVEALDFRDLYVRIERIKQQHGWYNLITSPERIQMLFADSRWYSLLAPPHMFDKEVPSNVGLWQNMALELLEKYCSALYKYERSSFLQPLLELRTLNEADENIPASSEYHLVVRSSEERLIKDIQKIVAELNEKERQVIRVGSINALVFRNHLYEPVLHVGEHGRIAVSPVSLNESEFQFLVDLKVYVENNRKHLEESDTEIFVLRNEGRGKGVGFFEAGNFYPDFLLWKIVGQKQCLAFIEPHGLTHSGPGHRKVEFYRIIKDIERRLDNPNIVLNSFIVTPTRYGTLNWGKSMEELEAMHVLFMNDQQDQYIGKILDRMCN